MPRSPGVAAKTDMVFASEFYWLSNIWEVFIPALDACIIRILMEEKAVPPRSMSGVLVLLSNLSRHPM